MPLARAATRVLAAYVLLTVLAIAFGTSYVSVWSGPIALVVAHLCPFVDVIDVRTVVIHGEHWLELQGVTRETLRLTVGTIPAGTPMSAATLPGYAAMHVVLIGSMVAAWPCQQISQRLRLALAALGAVAVATLLDIPFTLAGVARAEVMSAWGDQDVLVSYYRFIEAGGRPALSLLGAATAILIANRGARSNHLTRTLQPGVPS